MKKWGVLVLMSMAMFIIVIDTTIMNVSISDLVADLNTTVGGIQGAIALYALVMASLMMTGGKLADIVGKKRVFFTGLVIFGIGTTIASFAQGLGMLLIGWSVLEGIGSALMLPNIQTVLRGEYDGADRAYAYGITAAVAAVGAAAGPIVGGLLTTYASWRWAFRLEVVIVIVVLALHGWIRRDELPDLRPKLDITGAVLAALGWSTIVLGVLLAQDYGMWLAKKPLVIGGVEIAPFGLSIVPFLIGFGVICIMLFFRWERRLEHRGGDGLFRPTLLRIEGLRSGIFVRFLQLGIMASFLFVVPLMLQLTFNYTAIETGVALIPYSLGVLVTAVIGARLASRFSAKRIIQVGYALAVVGLISVTVSIKPGVSPQDLVLGAVFGLGMGLVTSQIVNLILSAGKAEDTAEIAGFNATFEQLGNSIGVALAGTIMLATLTAGLQHGIVDNPDVPPEYEEAITTALQQSVDLVSNAQLQAELEAANASDEVQATIIGVYDAERTRAFQASMLFLVFLAIVGLVMTAGMTDGKLVET